MGLTNIQMELLKTFSFNLSDKQLFEIKGLISTYLAEQITFEMDELFEEKSWGDEKLEEWENEHMRAKYE